MICNLSYERDIVTLEDVLSKKGILMKPTKNLVTIVSSLWTRGTQLKKIYANVRNELTPPSPVHIRSHFDGPPSKRFQCILKAILN